jgi:hypothetical protein
MRKKLFLLLTVAMALAGCGSGSDDGNALDWDGVDRPTGAAGALVWADRPTGQIHLADGVTLDAGQPISSFVAAGRGAYAVDQEGDALIEVTPTGARTTGAHVDKVVKASADGRYLAFLDLRSGPAVQGTHVIEAVVVDLETGRETARSTQGMGGEDTDDLVDLYEDAQYGVLAVTDKTAWFSVPEGGVIAVDVKGGEITSIPQKDISDDKNPWDGPRFAPEPADGPANPSRTWGISRANKVVPGLSDDPAARFPRDEIVSPDGVPATLRIDAVSWRFEAWIDDATVVGYANEGLDNPDRVKTTMDRSLATCTVPAGACTLIPDSAHAMLPEPSLY